MYCCRYGWLDRLLPGTAARAVGYKVDSTVLLNFTHLYH